MREARRANLAAVRLVGAVGDQIDAEFTLRRFNAGIDLAFRRLEAFGIELEVMDQGFHRILHFSAARRRHLMVGRKDRTRRYLKLVNALQHDLDRLAHLFDAAEIAVPAITVLAERDIELQLFVTLIRL